jgi:hypothetical protein
VLIGGPIDVTMMISVGDGAATAETSFSLTVTPGQTLYLLLIMR